jgi:hypothetical protein
MSEVRDNYLISAFKLSKHAGPEWFEFVEAFKLYVGYELERSLSSPNGDIAVAFGMGRCLIQMRDDFIGIEQKASKLEKKVAR